MGLNPGSLQKQTFSSAAFTVRAGCLFQGLGQPLLQRKKASFAFDPAVRSGVKCKLLRVSPRSPDVKLLERRALSLLCSLRFP